MNVFVMYYTMWENLNATQKSLFLPRPSARRLLPALCPQMPRVCIHDYTPTTIPHVSFRCPKSQPCDQKSASGHRTKVHLVTQNKDLQTELEGYFDAIAWADFSVTLRCLTPASQLRNGL